MLIELQTLVRPIAWLLWANKVEFIQFYILRKTNTWYWNYTFFSLLGETPSAGPTPTSTPPPCFPALELFQPPSCSGTDTAWYPGGRPGKSEASASWAPGHMVTASSSPPRGPQGVLWVRCHPSATTMSISEATFTQLLKRQISSIVSSLCALSNHSHGFALFILMVLLIIGVILYLQLSQRSQRLAVSNRGPERAVEAYLQFIHLHWFPLSVRVATVVTFFYSFWLSCDSFLAPLPHFSLEEAYL